MEYFDSCQFKKDGQTLTIPKHVALYDSIIIVMRLENYYLVSLQQENIEVINTHVIAYQAIQHNCEIIRRNCRTFVALLCLQSPISL